MVEVKQLVTEPSAADLEDPVYRKQCVEDIVSKIGDKREHILPIVQEIQNHFRYLPEECLEHVCSVSEITPSDIWGVATFYHAFRHKPMGKHSVRVCTGTACHVQGASSIKENICHIKGIDEKAGLDTDPDMQVTVEEVACLGCCTLAPVVMVNEEIQGPIAIEEVPQLLIEMEEKEIVVSDDSADEEVIKAPANSLGEIRISLDSSDVAQGADKVYDALNVAVRRLRIPVHIKSVGCWGMSSKAPIVEIIKPGEEPVVYGDLLPEDAFSIVEKHFSGGSLLKRISTRISNKLDDLLRHDRRANIDKKLIKQTDPALRSFMSKQVRIATEHYGMMNPLDLEEYIKYQGFEALTAIDKAADPDALIQTILDSGLRGRGGGGFPSGRKWSFVQAAEGDTKYVICNGDEGDPGAFMDRMLLESFPFRVIEGLSIAARAVGAHDAIFYIRAEYPLAVKRINQAIRICEQAKIIGPDAAYPMQMRVVKGGGAFVCGEETALINSIEGGRGTPRTRPPYPAHNGLWGKPTLINNVETLAMVPWIIRNGPKEFSKHGTETSKGTKVFALTGKVRYGGLVEVPMGITIREIVEDIGGGCPDGKRFKAILVGGPSGGCIPASLADTPVDYEELKALGGIMGSGGLVVLDEDDCVVDMARYFMGFAKDESCGQCSIGRIGTTRLMDTMNKMVSGKGKKKDLDTLMSLGPVVKNGSLCGLCQTAPNPILTTLKYFPEEYEAHINGLCPAGRCDDLVHYVIQDNCIGCTICSINCPTDAIPLQPYEQHNIIDELCIRCDTCYQVCPENAILVK